MQAIARRGMIALAALVVVACAALAVLTTISRREARQLLELNNTLRAVDGVRMALTQLGRASGLAYVTQIPAYAVARDRSERDFVSKMAQAR
ncbi:MAG TPA: hypothetical protein VK771_06040, partial [Acidimicrobiia bacterium]|nr:hypothetical protein [Acidimicrobiia bacterium]